MNNRDYKEFEAGECYHLYNRGVGKMDIFRSDEDYKFLLSRLGEYLHPHKKPMGTIARNARRKTFPENSFSLICYCLMPNHFHFLIRQNAGASLSAFMLNLWTGYSKYFNRKYQRVGSIFQDQFKAVHVTDDTYLKSLSVYIHQNPTVDGLVNKPEAYPFSSYREYIGLYSEGLCESSTVLEQFKSAQDYQMYTDESLESLKQRKEIGL